MPRSCAVARANCATRHEMWSPQMASVKPKLERTKLAFRKARPEQVEGHRTLVGSSGFCWDFVTHVL